MHCFILVYLYDFIYFMHPFKHNMDESVQMYRDCIWEYRRDGCVNICSIVRMSNSECTCALDICVLYFILYVDLYDSIAGLFAVNGIEKNIWNWKLFCELIFESKRMKTFILYFYQMNYSGCFQHFFSNFICPYEFYLFNNC